MEIRARYILMGLFLVAVVAGGFGFVYWLENSGGFRDRTTYRISFDGPVPGLYTGSSVLFNGIRVGEVTALRIRSDRPNEVAVDVAINANTPVRTDTAVDLEYQGLTGVASIALTGGKSGASLVSAADGIPTLKARHGAGQTITQSARDALLKLHGILDDNSDPLKELIGNINSFSGALARNSDKVDGILSGLERMTGGKKGEDADKVFDLAAATRFTEEAKPLKGQLMVPLPTAIFQLDTQNIIFRPARDDAPLPAGPRWSDNLTRLVQAKITQSFENAGYIERISQSDAITSDFQLVIDIRRFQMLALPEPQADIGFSARIVDNDGKVVEAKLFEGTASAQSTETEPAVEALNQAFKQVASKVVAWTAAALKKEPQVAQKPKGDRLTPDAPSSDDGMSASEPAETDLPTDAGGATETPKADQRSEATPAETTTGPADDNATAEKTVPWAANDAGSAAPSQDKAQAAPASPSQ